MSHIPSAAMPHAVDHDSAFQAAGADDGIVIPVPASLRATPALIAAGLALVGGLAVAALPLLRKAAKPAPKRRKRRARAA